MRLSKAIMRKLDIKIYKLILILCVTVLMAGCATESARFRLDPSLQSDIRSFGSAQYLPLERLCSTYGTNYKWDPFSRTATVGSGSSAVVLRDGSSVVLASGSEKKLDAPVVIYSGKVFVPVSFAKKYVTVKPAEPVVVERVLPPEMPKKAISIKTIVLDPGHGGHDVGAVGRRIHLREKHLALTLAKKVRAILEANGINVIMTRSDDTFIPLSRRAAMANSRQADLFVAIHFNASRSSGLRGFECYYLSNATDDNARSLESIENNSLNIGDEAEVEHSRQLDKTLWDMKLSEDRAESAQLAGYICNAVENSGMIEVRGVRTARFYVLKNTRMPAVLVEGGYISNKFEEQKIKDPKFMDRMAESVAAGIMRYKKEYEQTSGYTT